MAVNIRELEAAERLLDDIEADFRHPVNDEKHRNHKQALAAYSELKSKAAQTRATLAAERHFSFDFLEKNIK